MCHECDITRDKEKEEREDRGNERLTEKGKRERREGTASGRKRVGMWVFKRDKR